MSSWSSSVWRARSSSATPSRPTRISDRVTKGNPKIAGLVVKADAAKSRDERRLAVVHLLLKRRRGKKELSTFTTPGPNALAAEAVRLAKALPKDPRVPEILHLAVRATRYGCRDRATTDHSRRAFRHLHRHYPGHEFTKKTKYHY